MTLSMTTLWKMTVRKTATLQYGIIIYAVPSVVFFRYAEHVILQSVVMVRVTLPTVVSPLVGQAWGRGTS